MTALALELGRYLGRRRSDQRVQALERGRFELPPTGRRFDGSPLTADEILLLRQAQSIFAADVRQRLQSLLPQPSSTKLAALIGEGAIVSVDEYGCTIVLARVDERDPITEAKITSVTLPSQAEMEDDARLQLIFALMMARWGPQPPLSRCNQMHRLLANDVDRLLGEGMKKSEAYAKVSKDRELFERATAMRFTLKDRNSVESMYKAFPDEHKGLEYDDRLIAALDQRYLTHVIYRAASDLVIEHELEAYLAGESISPKGEQKAVILS